MDTPTETKGGGFGYGGLAFLLGGLAGIVAGLMLAPAAGKETREKAKRWLRTRPEPHAAYEAGRKVIREVEKKLAGVG